MQLQLSITMLVSDRPGSVERCLDSLVPILQGLPSELIVVFTGKDSAVREKVGKYTDQIVDFEWCDDFSKARNAGLERASGEWVMYLDDDEWFENPEEIVRFFSSGEYREYNYGCYLVRNYKDWEGRHYLQTYVSRLSRRYPETCFMGKIHEYLSPRVEPVKYLQAWVHHYGYVDGRGLGSARVKKADRNIQLLEKEIKAGRDLVRNYTQLAQEYACDKDYGKSVLCAEKLLGLIPPDWFSQEVCYILANLPYWIAESGRDNRKALETGERILKERRPNRLCTLYLYMTLCQICMELKEYGHLLHYACRFKELYEELEQEPEVWVVQEVLNVSESTIQANRYRCYLQGLEGAAEVGDAEKALYFLRGFPWGEMEARLYQSLDEWKERHGDRIDTLGCLSQLNQDEPYLWLQKALAVERDGEESKISGYYGRCLDKGGWEVFGWQLIQLALRSGQDMAGLLESMDLDSWKAAASQISRKMPKDHISHYLEAVHALPDRYDFYKKVFMNVLWERQLREQGLDDEEFVAVLHRYCENVSSYYAQLYVSSVLEQYPISFFPQEYQFAFWMNQGLDSLNGLLGIQDGIRAMKHAVKIYQHMIQVVRRLLDLLNQKLTENAAFANPEFLQLGVQVQSQAEALMAQGKYQEAYAVISQLCQLMPGNLQALRLKVKLYRYI